MAGTLVQGGPVAARLRAAGYPCPSLDKLKNGICRRCDLLHGEKAHTAHPWFLVVGLLMMMMMRCAFRTRVERGAGLGAGRYQPAQCVSGGHKIGALSSRMETTGDNGGQRGERRWGGK